MEIGSKLRKLEHKWKDLINKNLMVQIEVARLEEDIEKLKDGVNTQQIE